jgi:DNA-directed RNA polymerase specialized sigma24 family protein
MNPNDTHGEDAHRHPAHARLTALWEDVNGPLQDVFLRIHAHIDTLKEQDKLRSWIYQIAHTAVMASPRTILYV